ncbi:cytochrome c oxidase assembly protein COX16 homolog, mitochondrial isoform X4 [Chrysemys picta bellii]|uniref:cytochrome c oxidase assembly protein COX16 homolog, mitochondrial isoform X4 n=1 Tax=Chrysemys picta bellii TaxID=8478 RepID=UPI000CE65129|nr:cytochrome c oxidase assembly protein COX16 homolog, mitochondrial isoform X3 [Chrysemys picta bellii]
MQEAAARSLRRGLERLRPLVKNKTLRYGVPMMLLIIGGSFGLREFTQIRYDAQKLHSKKLKSSDFDDWKNVRGPRPWEDSKSLQEQQQQVLHSKPS